MVIGLPVGAHTVRLFEDVLNGLPGQEILSYLNYEILPMTKMIISPTGVVGGSFFVFVFSATKGVRQQKHERSTIFFKKLIKNKSVLFCRYIFGSREKMYPINSQLVFQRTETHYSTTDASHYSTTDPHCIRVTTKNHEDRILPIAVSKLFLL